MINFNTIHRLILMTRQSGQEPVEIHLSPNTLEQVKEQVRAQRKTSDTRSVIQRMRNVQPEPKPEGQFFICGLPAFANSDCEENAVAIRPRTAMGNPNWLHDFIVEGMKAKQEAVQETPWHVHEEVVKPQAGDGVVSASALSQGSLKPSPSDVLFKAFEDADSMSEVIIVRVHKNGDTDMCSSMPKVAATGYLQKILSKIMYE